MNKEDIGKEIDNILGTLQDARDSASEALNLITRAYDKLEYIELDDNFDFPEEKK